jgi:hypothetical protein
MTAYIAMLSETYPNLEFIMVGHSKSAEWPRGPC